MHGAHTDCRLTREHLPSGEDCTVSYCSAWNTWSCKGGKERASAAQPVASGERCSALRLAAVPWPQRGTERHAPPPLPAAAANMSGRETTSNELTAPEPDPCIRTFKEHMHLELEPPKLSGKRSTSPKLSPRSSPRLFRKLMVNKGMRQRRRFTVAHTW
ncbi:hypothetical protein SKAU_G00068080 [Synaphobranchus kaupii]|uniref:Uncharacterized protein n=1 Tax=Synaphobranchus kaupii TaxID=118154 RepID=A0A9Q1G736_SYNKA|nr:hypothetical protein SKAU_G00068080 [Synaphobranchus kaupii]